MKGGPPAPTSAGWRPPPWSPPLSFLIKGKKKKKELDYFEINCLFSMVGSRYLVMYLLPTMLNRK